MEKEETPALDLGSLGSFDFTPDWAKKDAGVTVGKSASRGDDRPPRRDFGDGKGRGDRPQGERKFGGERKGGFQKKPFDRGERRPRFEDRPKPLDVEVKVLPETKALGTIIRKLQQDTHAYKLKELAYFFLDNPQSVLLKITPKAPAAGEQPKPLGFHQCKVCGFASTSEADVIAHAVAAHLGDYYEAKEIACEPPKGNFNCVAKCGLSGVLLGPPNIHEFNATVREMIRTRYPEMSEEAYRARIEMVRDAEAIEQWRQSAVKKTVFLPKAAASSAEDPAAVPQLTREQAEAEFKRLMLPAMLDVPKNLMITADVAMKSPLRPLQWAAKDALEAERRAPYGMCFALRGAFHHRKMHFFRANDARGPEFVIGVEPKAFDVAHAIPELAKVATFVTENPCATKAEIASDAEGEKHLAWLVSTGHVIAFTNGVYSAVEKFPKYGPQWQKKRPAKAEPAPAAPVEAEPVASVEAKEEIPEVAEVKENEAPAQLAE